MLKNIILNKKIYAYDTFEGMSQPDEIDKTFDGQSASSTIR